MTTRRLPLPRSKAQVDASLAIVNIVLLLIFFFLATGGLINSGAIEIALPETEELPLDMLPKPLIVVGADRSMTLDGVAVEPGTLGPLLVDFPTLHVLADRDTSAATVLSAIAAEDLVAVEIKLVTVHRNATVGAGAAE
ncbi:hypothetical protein GCM10011360_08700 [Primorskyibacter flagellatus]|uniref:Biopolymer transporter ExbD n=1 Tax=Primorskyibacter flagellatus TaxID=1387277 RepID=A0A917A2S6_9RHOB|nr:biopolymer transporter ExbD [Primorskyibacter flagellatus]GGE22456.1 hypothetical protein GCM10011360_08700 [Primorskyibacter flagellatus]